MTFEHIVNSHLQHLASRDGVFVLQVGAADGQFGDFLHQYLTRSRWDALLLEPVPKLHERLMATYAACPQIHCERLAITSHDGHATLYVVEDSTELPWWAEQLGSLHRCVVESHESLIPDLKHMITEIEVPCCTIQTLLKRYQIRHIDLAAIDAEGYDDEIVRQLLNLPLTPERILFEHKHLSSERQAAIAAQLFSCGYQTCTGPWDTFCFLPAVSPPTAALQSFPTVHQDTQTPFREP